MHIVRRGNEPIAHKARRGKAQRTALLLTIALAFSIALIACGRPLPTPTPPPTETPTETPIPSPTATPPPTGTATPPPSPTQIPPPPTATSTVVPTPTLTPIDERIVLEIFYAETNGRDWWRNDNWLTDAPLGEWFGVTTNDDGNVIELDMLSNGLNGELPPELGSLAELTKLRLGNTSINTTPCYPFTGWERRFRCWTEFSGGDSSGTRRSD